MYYLIDINNVVGNDKNAKGEAIKQKFRAYNSMDDYAKDKVQFLKKLYDFDENDDIATFTSKLTGANKGKRRYAEAKNYNTLLTNVYNKIAKGQEGLKINWKPDRPSIDVAKTVKEYGPSFASMILTGNPSSFINKILEGKKPSLDYTHKFGSTNNKFQEFASVMTPIFKEALEKNGFPLTNLNNIVRQAALESSYGLDPRGERGFNLGGIKHPGDSIAPKYKKTKHTDGEYYIDFDNLSDYASYKVKLLNDRYNALDARNTNDFIDRLHGNNPNKSNYSADKKSYLRNLNGTKSLDKFLRRGGVIKYQEPAQSINRSAIRTDEDRKVPKYNRAVYSSVNPIWGIPNSIIQAGRLSTQARIKSWRDDQDNMEYSVGTQIGDSVADAAWRKRLGLSYDSKFLPKFNGDTVRLPKQLEMEIPTDTNMLKKRIANTERLMKRSSKYKNSTAVNVALKSDQRALKALRDTYKTGKAVGLDEYSNNSRQLVENGEINEEYISPLNVFRNYNIRYDKDTDKMYYSKSYDFDTVEHNWDKFVPGTKFYIRGFVDLNKK